MYKLLTVLNIFTFILPHQTVFSARKKFYCLSFRWVWMAMQLKTK